MLVLLLLALAAPPPDLAALGVIVAARPGRSVAVLRSGGRTRSATVGDVVFGGRLVQVLAGSAVLDFEGRTVTLRVAGTGPAAPSVAPAAAAAPASASARTTTLSWPGPSSAAGTEHEMARADVERRIGQEATRILAETTLLPAMENGAVSGYTLTRVPDGSILTDAGLRAGDVLVRVNGTPIDGLPTLIGLWPRLQGESTISADVLRDGVPLTLTVKLK